MCLNRIIGVDYGDKNIGVALSCPNLAVALSLETIRRDSPLSFKKPILRIREILREYDARVLVLGFPKNMDGSLGAACEKTLDFKERLHRNFKSLEIVLWDERLTSVSASRALSELGFGREEALKRIDETSAALILQGYLDFLKNKG